MAGCGCHVDVSFSRDEWDQIQYWLKEEGLTRQSPKQIVTEVITAYQKVEIQNNPEFWDLLKTELLEKLTPYLSR